MPKHKDRGPDEADREEEPRVVNAPLPPIEDPEAQRQADQARKLAGNPGPILTRNEPGQRAGGDIEERRQPQAGGRGERSLAIVPGSYNADDHSVEVVLSSGAAVARSYFIEELEISDTAIDLSRVASGVCPLLDTHNQYELAAQIGRVVTARVEGGQLVGLVQFDQTDEGQQIEARVARGELRAISIGYRVTTWTITTTTTNSELDTWRATSWELLEASFVPVPADPNAVVRSAPGNQQHGTTQEEDDMRRNLPGGAAAAAPSAAAPAQTTIVVDPTGESRSEPHNPAGATAAPIAQVEHRAAGVSASRILEMCGRSAQLGMDFAAELIRANDASPLTEHDLLGRVNERLLSNRPTVDVRAGATGTESEEYRRAIETAVMLKFDPSLSVEPADAALARDFRGLSLMEMARDYMQRTGIDHRGANKLEIAGVALGLRYGAHTTSDFANALSSAVGKRVRRAYGIADQTFDPLVSMGTLPDFKATNIVGLGDAPQLLLVQENAEFTYGAMSDTGMSYRLQTYGRVVAITRQAIINDDKRLFTSVPDKFGFKAKDTESDLVWGLITGNTIMGDGFALFSAQHGNLGTAADITVDSVAAGRLAMAQQKTAEGGFTIIRPAYLVVGPAMQTKAEQFLTAVAAAQTSNVNPFVGSLQLIVENRITDKSWYLFGDKNRIDTIELSHLEGQEGVFIETQPGFDVDGIKTKARIDVGGAVIDYRGMYKNPGL